MWLPLINGITINETSWGIPWALKFTKKVMMPLKFIRLREVYLTNHISFPSQKAKLILQV